MKKPNKKYPRKISVGEAFCWRESKGNGPWTLVRIAGSKPDPFEGGNWFVLEDVSKSEILEDLLLEANSTGLSPEVLPFEPCLWDVRFRGILRPLPETWRNASQ